MKKVLIVEDDSDIAQLVTKFLERNGYEAIAAENGSVALDHIHTNGLPHLILLDMKMPVLNGWQFAEQFHDKYANKAPIVVMTAAGDVQQRARDVAADGYIGKPFKLSDLLETVRKFEATLR